MMDSKGERMGACRKINWFGAVFSCLLIATLSLLLYSCGGGFRTVANAGDVNGTWHLSLTQSNGTAPAPETEFSIAQKERYGPFSGTSADKGTLSGTLNSEYTVITFNKTDGSVTTLTGAASKDWNSFSGTYTSTGSDGSGTWILAKNVPPPTPTGLSVTPKAASLSCSPAESQIFIVTGGTLANYSVTASANSSLVRLDTANLTTTGKFTVTAAACPGTNSAIVELRVTDNVSTVTVAVTISTS